MSTTQDGYPLVVPGFSGREPGIQLGTQLPPTASDDELRFAQQLGVEWAMTMLPDGQHTFDNYLALKQRFAQFGLKIYRLANHRCHNMPSITLNLPDRDERLQEYLDYLRLLGRAGIHYSTYAHMGNGIWSSQRELGRGGAEARALRLDQNPVGHWKGEEYHGELTHGRRYTEEELWDNYAWFIERVVPVAEEAGVFIGVHPDDPPVYDLGGIPRCVFGTFDGYRRAIELANSPNVGVCLCVGCWLEGGEAMGAGVVDTIRHFAGQRKLFKVHLRNVTAALPEGFVETFLDDGYGDMLEVMRALHETGFTGVVISDHLPSMAGGRFASEGYAIGYLRALRQAVMSVV